MFGLESLGGVPDAATTVGVVLIESILLYIGYGVLGSVVSSTILDAIRGD